MAQLLVVGDAASGKSAYAEAWVQAVSQKNRVYLATMQIHDAESQKRVERHRKMRAQKGFDTIECPFGPQNLVPAFTYQAALLECLSTLSANLLFEKGQTLEQTEQTILHGVAQLAQRVPQTVVVSNAIFADGEQYDVHTQAYLALLGKINQTLAKTADAVVEVVCGIPVVVKGREVVKQVASHF